jgi:hypothetical protein
MAERDIILSRIEDCIRLTECREHQELADYEIMDNLLEFKKWLIEPQEMVEGKTGFFCPVCDARLTPIDKYCWSCGQSVKEGERNGNQITPEGNP